MYSRNEKNSTMKRRKIDIIAMAGAQGYSPHAALRHSDPSDSNAGAIRWMKAVAMMIPWRGRGEGANVSDCPTRPKLTKKSGLTLPKYFAKSKTGFGTWRCFDRFAKMGNSVPEQEGGWASGTRQRAREARHDRRR